MPVPNMDHPRIRGEHVSGDPRVGCFTGSSPHTRGAHQLRITSEVKLGIIPAYAGSTTHIEAPRCPQMGSSPHTRGAQIISCSRFVPAGIIPAYAGSTSGCPCLSTFSWDHPRIRGEHSRLSMSSTPTEGSSPHTRGARGGFYHAHVPDMDHPRIRGEHLANAASITNPYGSSPHTRGARARTIATLLRSRIIPAYAGSTYDFDVWCWNSWDHPRIRGEHVRVGATAGAGRGSSPHTRGAPVDYEYLTTYYEDHPRIRGEHLPARRGRRRSRGSSPHTRGARPGVVEDPFGVRDHPRIRGEHLTGPRPEQPPVGSSPHTRGAHTSNSWVSPPIRIIPAYAGSTRRPCQRRRRVEDHPRIRGEH